jgi:hypothetical protein
LCFLFLPFIAFSAASLWSCEFPPAALIAANAIIIVACHLCRLDSFNAQLTSLSRHMPSCPLSHQAPDGISAVAADQLLNSQPLLVKAQ